jgi:hypothetical protein
MTCNLNNHEEDKDDTTGGEEAVDKQNLGGVQPPPAEPTGYPLPSLYFATSLSLITIFLNVET